MDFTGAQKEVDDWIKSHGVRYFSDLANMARIAEEVGEVQKRGLRISHEASITRTKNNNDKTKYSEEGIRTETIRLAAEGRRRFRGSRYIRGWDRGSITSGRQIFRISEETFEQRE